jgi:hypothetical protein
MTQEKEGKGRLNKNNKNGIKKEKKRPRYKKE